MNKTNPPVSQKEQLEQLLSGSDALFKRAEAQTAKAHLNLTAFRDTPMVKHVLAFDKTLVETLEECQQTLTEISAETENIKTMLSKLS